MARPERMFGIRGKSVIVTGRLGLSPARRIFESRRRSPRRAAPIQPEPA